MLRLVRMAVVASAVLALVGSPFAHLAGRRGEVLEAVAPSLRLEPGLAPLEAVTVDVHADGEAPRPGGAPRPAKNQKRAPCIPGLEVEVGGYCWLPIKARPPHCPPQSVAYGGDCLLPMAPQPRPGTSVDAGVP
ncbi:MAG TPA: hypothetical protein VEU33_05900 [Archangium sp.]|nr:hypothetical protein [Archangium sp.]